MKATIAWWDLAKSTQTIATLRNRLSNNEVEPWKKIKGLRSKFWISEAANNLWGALMLWESEEYMQQTLPPNLAAELIGYPPTMRLVFKVEALVEENYETVLQEEA